MIKLTAIYPNEKGKKFDFDYYCYKHFPMVQQKLGAALKGIAVEKGLNGPEPGSPAPYIAMGHAYFDSVEALQTAWGPHDGEIMADVSTYTDIQPTLQISEVKIL